MPVTGTVTTHVQDSGGSAVSGRTITVAGVGQTTDASGNATHTNVSTASTSAVITGSGADTYAWTAGTPGSGSSSGAASGSGTTATIVVSTGLTTQVQFVETVPATASRKMSMPGLWGVT